MYRLGGRFFLVLWLSMLLLIDISTFPMYTQVLQRLRAVEIATGSVTVPEFLPGGHIRNHEFIAVGVLPMSTDEYGATFFIPYFIHKSQVGEFLKHDQKEKYKKKEEV